MFVLRYHKYIMVGQWASIFFPREIYCAIPLPGHPADPDCDPFLSLLTGFWYYNRMIHPYPAGLLISGCEKKGEGCASASVQMAIFRNRYAPITVIATVKPPITAKQMTGLICETPVRP